MFESKSNKRFMKISSESVVKGVIPNNLQLYIAILKGGFGPKFQRICILNNYFQIAKHFLSPFWITEHKTKIGGK